MITDRQVASSYIQMYEQGVEKKEVRSYEVSIWTLQDEFITVLKWSDVEQKGRIQDPQLTIADDGTQEFKFSIPMYLYDGEKLVENSIWYNTRNGNIAINLRKIKVIFNKRSVDEKIFEFLITKVTETHEGDELTCNIECEGLAFHELGKIGYTISLSLDDYDLVYKKWLEEDGTEQNRPKQNVQFWCELIGLEPLPSDSNLIKSSQWYYEIDMNWKSVGGVIRNKNIVYEEPFIADWNEDLTPIKIEEAYEKERTIEVQESNIYNITQEIAKQFGIFCRYEYKHDKNNHIIWKTVVFFNNCLHGDDDKELMIGFTYPHSSKKVSREVDSKDIVTKMYVRPMEDPSVLLGEANITYCSANKTSDDYILNFDYLKETGSLTDEQSKAIEEYELAIHEINNVIIPLQNKAAEYERQKIDLEAKVTTYRNSITLDKEQINQNSDLAQSLSAKYGNGTQYIDVFNDTHPDQGFILQDTSGFYYINLKTKQKGIKTDSIRIYRNYSSGSNPPFSNEITGFKIKYDEYGNPDLIYGIAPEGNSNKVYMTYEYEPHLYYDNVLKVWEIKLGADQEKYKKALLSLGPESSTDLEYDLSTVYSTYAQGQQHTSYNNAIENEKDLVRTRAYENGLNYMIISTRKTIEDKITEKQQIIKKFNNLMGPALREGYWQPEKYETYGKHYNESQDLSFNFTNILNTDTKDKFVVGWDDILFDEEIDIKYESGIDDQSVVYYPCINLSNIYTTIRPRLFEYSFIFNNNYYNKQADLNKISNIRNFSINANRGGEAVFSFIRVGDTVVPALVLTGAKNMTEDQIDFMLKDGHPRLGIINTTINNGNINTTIEPDPISLSDIACWTFYPVNLSTLSNNFIQSTMGSCSIVYPRIKFSSLMLKTDPTNLFMRFANQPLEQFEDYYIRTRSIAERNYYPEYLITIKPERFAISNNQTSNSIMIDYVLSNASTSIYLDALKIEKENAYPKVSYTIDPNVLNKAMIKTLYNKLSWIVHINDAQLKLKDAYGYISRLVLDLDFPDRDTIEVKNYTTKFEDLFSTIVAQTENMQRNEGLFNRLARGQYALSGNGLTNTLNTTEMNNYFDTYFSESNTVQEMLYNLFQEAGAILSDSTNALNQIQSLSQANSTILNGFANRVQNELVPQVFRQAQQPDEFKKGDIWIEVNANTGATKNTYLAVSDSDNARNGHGWMKTYDGSLSQIEGAVLNVDAQAGKIDITAQDVSIVGNQSVNIGGTIINIGSNTIGNSSQQGAVNIFAVSADHITDSGLSSSRVLIDPKRIEMAGAKITMLVGTQKNAASAIDIDGRVGTNMPDYGIWLGSSKGIKLYTGNGTSNANVEINPNHIIFGLDNMSNDNATAVEMTTSQILLAAGSGLASLKQNGITTANNIAGVQITNNKIALAIGSETGRSAIIMDSNGLIIGAGANDNGTLGSLVTITGTLVNIGTNGNFNVNANGGKFIIKTNATGDNNDKNILYIANNATWASATTGIQYLTDGTLNVKGAITATSFTLGSGVKIPYSSISGAPNPSDYQTDGLDYTANWNQTGKSFVTLTSSTGLLIGATNGIVVPSSNSAAGLTAPYLKIDDNGIELNGKHIKINGQQEWSRDDIVILKNGEDQATIENNNANKEDWVLIKPYYNANWSYSGNSIGDTQLMDGNIVTLFTTTYTDQDLFADGLGEGGYTYTFKIYAKSNMKDDSEVEASIRLALTSQDGSDVREAAINQTNKFKLKSWAWHEFSLTCGINILFGTGTGRTITCTVKDVTGRCLVRQASVVATCNVAARNRVPCTVYYYPKK